MKIVPKYVTSQKENAIPAEEINPILTYYANWLQNRKEQLKNNMGGQGDVYNEIRNQVYNAVNTDYIYNKGNYGQDISGYFRENGVLSVDDMINDRSPRGEVGIDPNAPNKESVELHEGTHAAGRNNSPQVKSIAKEGPVVRSEYYELTPENTDYYNYLNQPEEIYARMMQFRKLYKLNPTKVYKVEEIRPLLQKNEIDGVRAYDPVKFTKLLNEIAYNLTSLPYAKRGGKLIPKPKYLNL